MINIRTRLCAVPLIPREIVSFSKIFLPNDALEASALLTENDETIQTRVNNFVLVWTDGACSHQGLHILEELDMVLRMILIVNIAALCLGLLVVWNKQRKELNSERCFLLLLLKAGPSMRAVTQNT